MTDGAEKPQGPTVPSDVAGNAPAPTGPFFQPTDWLGFCLTSVVVLAGYLRTLAPEVTLGMSGLLATSANYAGVAGPPGYPVWTLYSWLFVKLLPFSNIAWRVAVGSAVAAALACGLVALMVSKAGSMLLETTPAFTALKRSEQKLLRIASGYVAGMALGFSQAVWGVAVVADTWAMSVLLFAITLCLLLRWTGSPEHRRFLYVAFCVFGLLLTNNQELLVMTPGVLVWVILRDRELGRDLSVVITLLAFTDWARSALGWSQWLGSDMLSSVWLLAAFLLVGIAALIVIGSTRRFGSEWKSTVLCTALLFLGLGYYFYLPLASMTNPPVDWAYAREYSGFVHGITRGQFPRYHPTDEPGQLIGQVWILAKATWKGFGWPFLGFTVVPFVLLPWTGRSARAWLLGLAAALVCVGPFMIALLNPPVDMGTDFYEPFFGAMHVVLALQAGLGLMVVGSIAAKPRMSSAI